MDGANTQLHHAKICDSMCFGARCLCPLPKTGGFDKNDEHDDFILGVLLLKPPETDKNNENGERHSRETTVCQKQCFRHPIFATSVVGVSKTANFSCKFRRFQTPRSPKNACGCGGDHFRTSHKSLATCSLLISEDLWLFLDFHSDRSTFSTFVGEYKNAAIAKKREEKLRNPH